jgi:preprotein translocase SecE subunit
MKKIFSYFGLIKNDIKTIHWPKKEELYKSYAIVLVLALCLGVYIFGIDYVFTSMYKLIIF